MSVDLYVLQKKSVEVRAQNGMRETMRFLQLAVANALAQDCQGMVDSALRYARGQWEELNEPAQFVVQVGAEGLPRPGSPIFKWPFFKRPYCFDHELSAPFGYLGDRTTWGYRFRTVREQASLNIAETARRIDEGTARVYKDFWHGELFESGEEFLRSRGQCMQSGDGNGSSRDVVSPRVSKILGLIRLIQQKGKNASPADLHFLGSLQEKAAQLGFSC